MDHAPATPAETIRQLRELLRDRNAEAVEDAVRIATLKASLREAREDVEAAREGARQQSRT